MTASLKAATKVRSAEPGELSDLSRQLLKAQEEERRRISRELHDETGQALMVLRFQLEMLAAEARSEDRKAKIQESLFLLDRTIDGLRRTIARLSPRVLEELGLITAIRRQAELLSRHAGLKTHLNLPDEIGNLDHDLQVAVYRSVQEALHNIAKHSRARNATVKLAISSDRLVVEVEDDGVGFSQRSAGTRGFGLKGMRERAAALGGTMRIRSRHDEGTRLRIVFHLEKGESSGMEKHVKHASAA